MVKTFFKQLGIDVVDADFVDFVDCNGYIYNFVGCTDNFGYSAKNLAVVKLDDDANAKTAENFVDESDKFYLIEEGIAANDIGVALIELAVTSLLRAIGTPHRLNLIALEWELQLIAVLHHIACERHCEVVAQTFLADARGEMQAIALSELLVGGFSEEIAAVKHLEKEFVAFFAIFAHQGRKVFERRCLDLLETIE